MLGSHEAFKDTDILEVHMTGALVPEIAWLDKKDQDTSNYVLRLFFSC